MRKLVSYYNYELSPLGITAPQMIALGVLCFQEDLSLGEFAGQMKIRKVTAVSMIKRLEAMGFVTKEAHPQDARLNDERCSTTQISDFLRKRQDCEE